MENDIPVEQEIIETPIETPEPPKEPEQSLRETIKEAAKEARERDDKGKFKTKEQKEEISKTVKPVEVKSYNVPEGWQSSVKEKWSVLPPEVQAEIARREEESHKKITSMDEERNFGKSMKEIVSPYMPIITAEGGDPAKAVQSLLNTAYLLRTAPPQQKVQLLAEIARTYNVDINQLLQPQQQQNPQIQTLQQRLDLMEREKQREIELKKQEETARVQTEINAFAADPKNVHYEKVKPIMGSLLGSGQASTMQEAYDKACRLSDEIYPLILQKQSEDSKRGNQVQAKKAAAVSVTGSPGISPNSTPERSLREEIRANLRAASS